MSKLMSVSSSINNETNRLVSHNIESKYYSDEINTDDNCEDVLTNCLRIIEYYATLIFAVWVFAFVILMLSSIYSHYYKAIDVLTMFLMLVSTGCGIYICTTVINIICGYLQLIPIEKINYVRNQGLNATSGVGQFVLKESLPLLRILLFWTLFTILAFVLIFIAEVQIIVWLLFNIIGLWISISPIIVIAFCVLVFMFASKSISMLTSTNFTIIFITVVRI